MFPLMYFNRIVRVTPILAVSILLSVSLMRFLGNGPLWPSIFETFNDKCKRNWGTTMLYVQNYANPSDVVSIFWNIFWIYGQFTVNLLILYKFQCFPPSLYLAVDMQLYLIAPVMVYSIYRFKAKALAILSLLVLGCIVCTVTFYLQRDIKTM